MSLLLYTGLSAQFVPQPLKAISPESAGYKAEFFDSFTKELEDSKMDMAIFGGEEKPTAIRPFLPVAPVAS